MLTEEKKKYLALEEKMRLVVSQQWEHLRSSIKQPYILHPLYWGHKTRCLRRTRFQAGSPRPHPSQQVPPPCQQVHPQHRQMPSHLQHLLSQSVTRPPGVQNRDTYTNRSRILTYHGDGDWQVGQSEDGDTSSEVSSQDIVVSREISVEVHAVDDQPINQGMTDSPTTGFKGIIYGDDVTTVSAKDVEYEDIIFPVASEAMATLEDASYAHDSDGEHDEDFCPEVRPAMTAHPPPYFSISEAREALGTRGADEWLVQPDQVEYDNDECCYQIDDHDVPTEDFDEMPNKEFDENVFGENCSPNDTSAQDAYHAEFSQFYANYEEGAAHLYYREEYDDAEAFENDEDDDADVSETDGD